MEVLHTRPRISSPHFTYMNEMCCDAYGACVGIGVYPYDGIQDRQTGRPAGERTPSLANDARGTARSRRVAYQMIA